MDTQMALMALAPLRHLGQDPTSKNLGTALQEGANWLWTCLLQHLKRMDEDPSYHEAIQEALEALAKRPGRVGQAARAFVAAQSFTLKVL